MDLLLQSEAAHAELQIWCYRISFPLGTGTKLWSAQLMHVYGMIKVSRGVAMKELNTVIYSFNLVKAVIN